MLATAVNASSNVCQQQMIHINYPAKEKDIEFVIYFSVIDLLLNLLYSEGFSYAYWYNKYGTAHCIL